MFNAQSVTKLHTPKDLLWNEKDLKLYGKLYNYTSYWLVPKTLLFNIKTNHFCVLIISESVIKIPTAYTIK